jgi:hypothetical protein
MKTLADLKRDLTIGTRLKMVYSDIPTNRLLNSEREISIVQTNSIALQTEKANGEKCNSWFTFPKAVNLEYDGNFFSIYENINGTRVKVLEYLIIR